MSEIEEWRDIPEYEDYYQVSNLGNVRSLDRWVVYSNGRKQFYKGRAIEGYVNKGYRKTGLSKDNTARTYSFSQLVAMAFLGHELNGNTLVVDHINGDKSDDRLENLRIVTNRTNVTTCFRADRKSLSSRYEGVIWRGDRSKWQVKIQFNKKTIYLGYFTDEFKAAKAYQSALSEIKGGSFNPDDYKPKFSSKHKGVSFYKPLGKWKAQAQINGKRKHIGYFPTELEAKDAYQSKLKELQSA